MADVKKQVLSTRSPSVTLDVKGPVKLIRFNSQNTLTY